MKQGKTAAAFTGEFEMVASSKEWAANELIRETILKSFILSI